MRPTAIWLAGLLLCCAIAACAQRDSLAERLEARARSGRAEASYHLGMLYNAGIVVAQDHRRALALFRTAAEAGDPLGAYQLGCYLAGQYGAIAPDAAQALRWKRVAAEAGYQRAQLDVAILHFQRRELAEALRWFEAAAHQGDAQALYDVSVMHLRGQGTPPSLAKGYAFFRLAHLAARDGNIAAGTLQTLDEMRDRMSATERAEADRIAASWVTGPTPLTRRAAAGQARAEDVAAGAP